MIVSETFIIRRTLSKCRALTIGNFSLQVSIKPQTDQKPLTIGRDMTQQWTHTESDMTSVIMTTENIEFDPGECKKSFFHTLNEIENPFQFCQNSFHPWVRPTTSCPENKNFTSSSRFCSRKRSMHSLMFTTKLPKWVKMIESLRYFQHRCRYDQRTFSLTWSQQGFVCVLGCIGNIRASRAKMPHLSLR